jgi:hypothetical protein
MQCLVQGLPEGGDEKPEQLWGSCPGGKVLLRVTVVVNRNPS